MSDPAFGVFRDFAFSLADVSGKAIAPYFRTAVNVANKAEGGAFDPVTEADRAAEKAIIDALAARFPDHALTGEEFGSSGPANARFRWIVDPIDGTRAFIMGYPLWGTLIALLRDGEVAFGLMDQPFTGERFWSEETGARARGPDGIVETLRTRACAGLEDAVLATTHPDLFECGFEAERFARVAGAARMTRYGGDCYAYCMLAAGHVDLIVEAGLKAFDIAALVPIIERAGGVVTTWSGEPASAGGRIIAAGDARVHAKALELLS